MEFQHIWAVTLRQTRLLWHDINLILIILYWPLLDVLIWGFLGSWLQRGLNTPGLEIIFLLGILLWQTVARTAIAVSKGLLEELWSKNLVNIFTAPIRLSEWALGGILYAILENGVVIFYCVGLIWFFYKLSLSTIFTSLVIFAPPLFISGIWIGFMAMALIIYFGRRVQELIWVLGWFFSPFSGAFYPIETLPLWAQRISHWIPMSYAFEGLRNYILHQQNPWPYLKTSYVLSITYASIAIILFFFMFHKTKEKGLTRLTY